MATVNIGKIDIVLGMTGLALEKAGYTDAPKRVKESFVAECTVCGVKISGAGILSEQRQLLSHWGKEGVVLYRGPDALAWENLDENKCVKPSCNSTAYRLSWTDSETRHIFDSVLSRFEQVIEPRATDAKKDRAVFGKRLKKSKQTDWEKKCDTLFPLPEDVQNFSETLKGGQVNFQTNLSLVEIADFYRKAFTAQGLAEVELVTLIADDFISLGFAGLPHDKKVIVQAVDIGYSSNVHMRNVNLRTEGGGPRRDRKIEAYWAYDFDCHRSLEGMLSVFNANGPWHWELRESSWYGDYLNAQPTEGVRVRVQQYPQTGEAGEFVGCREEGFSALLQIKAESSAAKTEIDGVFRGLLESVNAEDIQEIEPYD